MIGFCLGQADGESGVFSRIAQFLVKVRDVLSDGHAALFNEKPALVVSRHGIYLEMFPCDAAAGPEFDPTARPFGLELSPPLLEARFQLRPVPPQGEHGEACRAARDTGYIPFGIWVAKRDQGARPQMHSQKADKAETDGDFRKRMCSCFLGKFFTRLAKGRGLTLLFHR